MAGVVVLGAIMSILDITVVAVAPTHLPGRASTRPRPQVAWTMTGYTLALATVIPLTGWAADRFGTKRLYILAIVLFTAGSALCSTATSASRCWSLFRVLQGLGGGMLMPLGMTILTRAAGPERLGRVMADPRRPDAARPDLRPDPRRLADRRRLVALDLPDQRPDRHRRARLRLASCSTGTTSTPSESFDFVGMLLLSPGLALFLYGVSSIPAAKQEHGTMFTAKVRDQPRDRPAS